MTLKRLKQLVIGGAVVVGLALGAPAVAGAAAGMAGSPSPAVTVQAGKGGQPLNAGATVLASVRGGSTGATNHARDGSIPHVHLSDHEQYVRHHQRLA
jgi:hypothetical protein